MGQIQIVCMRCKKPLDESASALSAAEQSLLALGCELREGVWMKECFEWEDGHHYCKPNTVHCEHHECNGTGYLPILPTGKGAEDETL